jgi:hypothetical protein
VKNDAPGQSAGTYATTQTAGPALCGGSAAARPTAKPKAKVLGARITRGRLASTGQEGVALGGVLLLTAAVLASRLRPFTGR